MKNPGRGLVVALALWAATASGEDTPAPLVLRVFQDFYTAPQLHLAPGATECRDLEPLIKAVLGPLLTDYCEKNGVAATEADLKDYCRRLLPEGGLFKEAWAEWQPTGRQWRLRQQAAVELTFWKLQKSLFETYGGRVERTGGEPPQAFDAVCAYVTEREQAGDFTIHDARLKIRFWECLRTPKGGLVPAEAGRALIAEHPLERAKRLAAEDP